MVNSLTTAVNKTFKSPWTTVFLRLLTQDPSVKLSRMVVPAVIESVCSSCFKVFILKDNNFAVPASFRSIWPQPFCAKHFTYVETDFGFCLGTRRIRGWFPRRCAVEVMNGTYEELINPSTQAESAKRKNDWCWLPYGLCFMC